MRKTKIICTIGPSSQTDEKIREIIEAGMNVARCNFSHGDYAEQGEKVEKVRRISKELGKPVAVLIDTKGPEIRLGKFEEKIELIAGDQFILTTDEVVGTAQRASVTYKNILNDVEAGSKILIDDGLIEMTVDEIKGNDIICTLNNSGPVSSKKGVNLPGANLSMPFISDTDRADIEFGCEMKFDYLAASFVRCKDDILEVRKILDKYNSPMKIIAKIENMQGIKNLDEILEVSDGIMVARGDMGVEVPLEEVPIIQKMMIKKAIQKGKQVITATQMLESMTKNPRPTRAETTDVANAIYDGTTAIMLSGESANGKYPIESVMTMSKIAARTEADINYKGRFKKKIKAETLDITTAISHATCLTAMQLKAAAIITVTMSGFTASMVSRYKPNLPIIACTTKEETYRQTALLWGTTPLMMDQKETAEELFAESVEASLRAGLIKKGDTIVMTAGVPLGISGKTNMIRVVEV
ncbi:MAG: pyruvate kinase [Eubacteriales bacterium]